jgi:hypothetical protein
MNDGNHAQEPLKSIPDEVRAKAIQLQMALAQATMAGDATRGEQLRREYEALMERMQAEIYGQRQRDPVAVVEELIETGSFVDVAGGPCRATELCLCDAIYHGECQVVRGPLVVDALAVQRDDDGKIVLLLLRGKKLSAEKRLRHLGSVAADSGSMLILDAPIADRQTSEAVKRTVFAAGEGERVRTVAIGKRIGWLVSPGFGSGGFDVYAREALIAVDFLRVRDDPERMRY